VEKENKWYEEISPSSLITQGDILFGCPVFYPKPTFDFTNLSNLSNIELEHGTANLIILSQSCDLVVDKEKNRSPVSNVVCAKLDSIEGDSWGFVSEVNSGSRPPYHLINEKTDGEITMGYQIIDFAQIFTLPYDVLDVFREYSGKRLRLRSPYLEFVSQRFGQYFSRIGLPAGIEKDDLKEKWKQINDK
jgi:hypothetical protein